MDQKASSKIDGPCWTDGHPKQSPGRDNGNTNKSKKQGRTAKQTRNTPNISTVASKVAVMGQEGHSNGDISNVLLH